MLTLLACAVLLAAAASPAGTWLLERAPEGLLRRQARWLPWDRRAPVVLAERQLVRGEVRPALEELARAASGGGGDFRLAVALADATRAAGQPGAAAAQVRELLAMQPQNGRLHRILGECQLALGAETEGRASLERAAQLAPREAEVWIALAEARMAEEGFTAPVAQLWNEGRRHNPGSAELRYGLAETYAALGRYAEVEPLLADLDPRRVPAGPLPRQRYGRAWYARGLVLRRDRPDAARLARAREALETARSLAPEYPDVHYELGLLLADAGELAAARQSLETAVRLRPYAHPFWYHLARVNRALRRNGEAEAARRRFQTLVSTFGRVNREAKRVEKEPQNIERRLLLVRLLLDRQDWASAAAQLARGLELFPGHSEALRLLQRLRREQGAAARG